MKQANLFKYGFFALIVVIILILTFRRSVEDNDLYLRSLHERIELYENQILHLSSEITQNLSEISSLRDSIMQKSQELNELEEKRKHTIRYYENQISNISAYTESDLDSFFRARYPAPYVESQGDSSGLN